MGALVTSDYKFNISSSVESFQVEALIFLDPATDPFSGIEVGDFMSQNPGILNQYLTQNGYDVGHNYCRYLGGNAAGVAGGQTCSSGKGRGCSSGGGDYGDYFIGVVG